MSIKTAKAVPDLDWTQHLLAKEASLAPLTPADTDRIKKTGRWLLLLQNNRKGLIFGGERHKRRHPNLKMVETEFERNGLLPLFDLQDKRFICFDTRNKTFVVYHFTEKTKIFAAPNIEQVLRKLGV